MVTIDALDILCAQLTRDLFAIAKFLLVIDTLTDIQRDMSALEALFLRRCAI